VAVNHVAPAKLLRGFGRASKQVLVESLHEFKARPAMRRLHATAAERAAWRQLDSDGIAVIEGYWSRERAFVVRDKLAEYASVTDDREFDNGAYLTVWDEDHPKRSEQPKEDRGITRIYHVDKIATELESFRFDSFVLNVASAYYRVPMYSGLLQFQYNRGDTSETRSYHIDAFEKEFKAFLYLDDVDNDNGPFTYIKRTHRATALRLKKQIKGNRTAPPTSFSVADVKNLLAQEARITGPAGTLILADVRGLHRGSPQKAAPRSVLVNYLYESPGERRPGR